MAYLPKLLLTFISLGLILTHSPTFAQNVNTSYKIETIASGLEHPWAFAFLPDGKILVTERPGRFRIVSKEGKLSPPLKNTPNVHAVGQGGLLDVILAPDYTTSKKIIFTFAKPAKNGKSSTAIATAKLDIDQNRLTDVQTIFIQKPTYKNNHHFGARLAIAGDSTLFAGLGERFDLSDQAQRLDNHLGKVIRINIDGSIPKDNPFIGKKGALPEIWSYGHRNIQGMTTHPATGVVWHHEHGPRGGDEINILQPGKNYGWPEASYGSHYTLLPIRDDHKGQGFEEPLYYWTPSIAPSGMMFYTGDLFPDYKGNLFVGALAKTHLARLVLDGTKVVSEEKLLTELESRIRDVRQGPDGAIYVISDQEDGRILRLVPN